MSYIHISRGAIAPRWRALELLLILFKGCSIRKRIHLTQSEFIIVTINKGVIAYCIKRIVIRREYNQYFREK